MVVNELTALIQSTEYYPFGMSVTSGTGPDSQPYKHEGKELDLMHGLNLYDSSARWYDPVIGRFTSMDPLAEKYYNISPYAYCANNPMRYVDPTGEDYWSTNDPSLITQFINSYQRNAQYFDFSGWSRMTNNEFESRLSFNDETGIGYLSYGYEENGESVVSVREFNANFTPVSFDGSGYPGAFVYEYGGDSKWYYYGYDIATSFSFAGLLAPFDPSRYGLWSVNSSGRIIGLAPITGTPPVTGMKGKSLNQINKLIKSGKAPKTIIRGDKGKISHEKDHIHFDNGAALNVDGTWKHGSKALTNQEIKFLQQNGIKLPTK